MSIVAGSLVAKLVRFKLIVFNPEDTTDVFNKLMDGVFALVWVNVGVKTCPTGVLMLRLYEELVVKLGGANIYKTDELVDNILTFIGIELRVAVIVNNWEGQDYGSPNPVIFIVPPRVDPTKLFVVNEIFKVKGKELL